MEVSPPDSRRGFSSGSKTWKAKRSGMFPLTSRWFFNKMKYNLIPFVLSADIAIFTEGIKTTSGLVGSKTELLTALFQVVHQ